MADVTLNSDSIDVKFSLVDQLLGLHGSFHIPLAHVLNAYCSTWDELELQYKLSGTNAGFSKSVGTFANPEGLIFVDVSGGNDALVIETRG